MVLGRQIIIKKRELAQNKKGNMAKHFVESDLGFDPRDLGSTRKEESSNEPSGFSQAVAKLMMDTGVTEAVARAIVEQTYKQMA